MRHLIRAQKFDPRKLEQVFTLADSQHNRNNQLLKQKIVASFLYEPSARTRLSFEPAMICLSGNVITIENAAVFSSTIKGRNLEDSIQIVSG